MTKKPLVKVATANMIMLSEQVTFALKKIGCYQKAMEFNNRSWCCCNWSELIVLAEEFVELKMQ